MLNEKSQRIEGKCKGLYSAFANAREVEWRIDRLRWNGRGRPLRWKEKMWRFISGRKISSFG